MVLDPTLREENVWVSVRNFFLEELDGTGITPHFDNVLTSPEDTGSNQWVCVLLENPRPNVVSRANMTVFVASSEDYEGDDLARARDTVMEILYPRYIPLYDYDRDNGTLTKVGGMRVTITSQSRKISTPHKSKMVYVETILKWGAKW